MPVSLSPSMIQGVVVAIIVFLIQLLFLEFLVLANANMQREISNHCDFGSFTSIKVREGQDLTDAGKVTELQKATKSGGDNCGTIAEFDFPDGIDPTKLPPATGHGLDRSYTTTASANDTAKGTFTETVYSEDGNPIVLSETVTWTHGTTAWTVPGVVSDITCLLYTSPSPRDRQKSRMPSSA